MKQFRNIGHNTYEENLLGNRAILFHNTYILIFTPLGIKLNSGGWQTYTTKDRLNKHLPNDYHVWQEKHIWYVSWPGENKCEFEDGMLIPLPK